MKNTQEKYGSRDLYAKMDDNGPDQYQLFQREIAHIEGADGFYLSTVGDNGWPYVQFRGGPKGFVKVLGSESIGFADFRGNRQYISTGNLSANTRAALIFLNYPTRTRLKIWTESKILNPEEHPELADKLAPEGYTAKIERLIVFQVKAFDWNCPQHITPRYSVEEIRNMIHTDERFRQLILTD